MTNATSSTQLICQNCNADVDGAFCSQCGQEVESNLKYFWVVLLHILDDIFSFDSRAARTVKPLLGNPGFLTNEYISGRRVHYVPPLKLYLFISIIFFISLKFFSFADETILVHEQRILQTQLAVTEHISSLENELKRLPSEQQNKQIELLDRLKDYKALLTPESPKAVANIAKRMAEIELRRGPNRELSNTKKSELEELSVELAQAKKGGESNHGSVKVSMGNTEEAKINVGFLSEKSNQRLNKKVKALERKAEDAINTDARPLVKQALSKLPQLMFVLLPVFALLLKVLFLFANRLYLEHLTVALHSHSFIFLSFLIMNLLSAGQTYSQENYTWLSTGLSWVNTLLFIWVPIYLFIMQKRVYKQGYLLTTLKFGVIGFAYFNIIAITSVIAFIWGLTDL